jgi:hypothetical protein
LARAQLDSQPRFFSLDISIPFSLSTTTARATNTPTAFMDFWDTMESRLLNY